MFRFSKLSFIQKLSFPKYILWCLKYIFNFIDINFYRDMYEFNLVLKLLVALLKIFADIFILLL
jgi:hypothetical protein